MTVLSATPMVNAAIARARTLPELIASLPPGMAAQLETKPLLLSRSPPAVLLATGIAWVSTKYGLGWDDTICSMIAGGALLLVGYLMRMITKQAVAGIVTTPQEAPPAVAAALTPVERIAETTNPVAAVDDKS